MSQEHQVTVRVQKVKKQRIQMKIFLFTALAAALLLITIFAKYICPYDPYAQDLTQAMQPPSAAHLMGTDTYGRDMLSRVLIGAQTSISSTFALVAIITVFGTVVGIFCGYYGGIVDSVMMRISDVCLAFPGLVFAMAVAVKGLGINDDLNGIERPVTFPIKDLGDRKAEVVHSLAKWKRLTLADYKIPTGQTLSVKNLPYMQASQMAGDSVLQMIFRHVLPNIVGPILVTSMLDIGTMMMEIAGLSFLGLGAQPPVAEWASMMSSGRSMLQTYPWIVLSPGLAIFISVVIFNLLGDSIRDYMDPKNTRSR